MIQRYDIEAHLNGLAGCYWQSVTNDGGDWVKWEDVEKLVAMEVDAVEYDYNRAADLLATIDSYIVRNGFAVDLVEDDS